MTEAIFVSPHLDDAALSCGGGIARLVRAGVRVTVVTVFTADQPPGIGLSTLARRSHSSWGVGSQPFEVRRVEDDDAMRLLGAESERLGMLDAIYRRSASGEALYADPLAPLALEDTAQFLPGLVAALRGSAAAKPQARVFCPAGMGGHVDHVLTRRAIERVADAEAIVYYDEYPYSARPGVSASGADGPGAWPSQNLALTDEELETKIAAIACYTSQLRGLFPTTAERVREIASARIPGIGHYLDRSPDATASAERMATRVRKDLAAMGGERYRWSPRRESPFLPA
jgi:LmbE family N-acetylglucosaminyl deacetylase